MKTVCPQCGKHSYPSMRQAIRVALKRSRLAGVALRPYQAHGVWHLTSQPKGEAA